MHILSLPYSVSPTRVNWTRAILSSSSYIILLLYCWVSVLIVHEKKYNKIVVKSARIWNVTLCSVIEVEWCFGRMYCLHLQSHRVSETDRQQGEQVKQETCFRYRPIKEPRENQWGLAHVFFFLSFFTGLYQNHIFHVLLAGCLLVVLFYPKDGDNMVLWNVGGHQRDYMASYPEDSIIRNHSCENFRSNKIIFS